MNATGSDAIIPTTASVTGSELVAYEGALIQPAASLPDIAAAFAGYRELCAMLLDDADFQPINGGQFLKKSGWRKLATAMGVTLAQVRREVGRDSDGRVMWAEFTYRATAPNGRYAEAEAACSTRERKFTHPDHDVIATAETRAKSRACSDLFGLGALSAEELDGGENGAGGSGNGTPPSDKELMAFRTAVRALAKDAGHPDEEWLRHRIVGLATEGRTESARDLWGSDMRRCWDELASAREALSDSAT